MGDVAGQVFRSGDGRACLWEGLEESRWAEEGGGHSASPQGSWSGEAPVSWRQGLGHVKVPRRSIKAPGRSGDREQGNFTHRDNSQQVNVRTVCRQRSPKLGTRVFILV